MSIWTRIAEALSALASGESLADVLAKLRSPPEQSVAFTIAVIALGAKMAKADGHVTRREVEAFREVFRIAPEDEAQAARVYNLARQDVAGFELYADRVARMFRNQRQVLEDLLEGLFHIALADGDYHPAEDAFLREVARRFALEPRVFRSLHARYLPGVEPDPYDVLGVAPTDDIRTIRSRWRALVRDTHPDRLVSRGVPEEAITLATRRLAAINDAWAAIQREHAPA
ncbi:molecular chaperone DjiA [Paroceanicella profunda]|uniref:Molecular chaperone DjiA n=1 Tax=Paroceanicella profunda TaxID=2579971 RepID=A0A5B8G1H4_9RHOB|nr:molecular chaperone DjiA [Paroceanicella profunda]QDL92333.1 molecular chaperone DjiA [Paroceanicella profunda]